MLYMITIAIGILIVALLGFAATKPDKFSVKRTRSIQAPPETIFELVNDFRQWSSWSPYEQLDPAMKRIYSGAANGKGAAYEWIGNRKAGEGRMEITDTSAPSKVTIKLDFLKPFEGHNIAEFALERRGDSTNVTWAMYGPQSYFARLMTIFFSMDKLAGKEFEAGLANIKRIAEGQRGLAESFSEAVSARGV